MGVGGRGLPTTVMKFQAKCFDGVGREEGVG